MNQSQAQSYTAAQIAAALGKPPQSVRRSLRDVPVGMRVVNGKEAAAWPMLSLPQPFICQLDAAALQRGYANAEAMLSAPPPAPWTPRDGAGNVIPLRDYSTAEIEQANKLRQALTPSLLRQHDLELSAGDFKAQGVADYAKVFGHTVTPRYFDFIFKRTVQRDAGAEDYSRIELYLPDKPASKRQPTRNLSPAMDADFVELTSYIGAFHNPTAPSQMEKRGVWTLAFEHYTRLASQGPPEKRAARRVRDFLFTKAAFLARTRNALLKSFNRKLAGWKQSGLKALLDGRENNGVRFDFPEADSDLLIHRAVFNYRGDVAPAWRDCLRKGFSEPIRQRYAGKAADKSHVPATVMDLIGPQVDILTVMHRGPRAFDSIKGFVSRNYDGIASLQCVQGDDFTLNSYFYVPDGNGWFNLTRGQVILFIDFRTLRILGWALEPRKSYSSLTIRSLCTHVFGEFGVPEVLYFERGLWKSATLLKGKTDPFNFTEISQGLREFGVHFIHAVRPRSKTIERVGGLFQDIAEGEPGYSGRDERRDAPESLRKQMAEVEARKVHPSKYFYSYPQWNHRIGELVEQFNTTSQEGRILAGLSPEEAFEKHLNRDNPPMQFGAQLRYLLAHEKRTVRVTLNGVTIQIGKQKFNYRGREIAHLVGRDALAWFDPENLDVLTVTDLDRQNPICVARSQEPGALELLTDPHSGTLARELERIEDQASFMRTRFNVVKAKFPLPERKALADAQTRELGPQIELQKSRVRAAAVKTKRQRVDANNLFRQTGMIVRDPAQLEGKADEARIVREFLNAGKESE
ncbi:MAG: hypothetical protein MUF81_10040 [Verrucomicrobia bacterium]|nr:hypothetical protein [Verrucomicrobiota bacterium]